MKVYILMFGLSFLMVMSCSSDSNSDQNEPIVDISYFPPLGTDIWETVSLSDLGWNEAQLPPLLNFLEEKNTKSFIILHHGKIVIESYMNGHTAASNWYWASAGKTLTTTVSGIAQEEGIINIDSKVSDYLGTGWTNAPQNKEDLISCKNLLNMTSGLDDTLGDGVSPENLQYVADAGTRWAYHNVYVKMQDVIENASNQTWTNYFNTTLKNRIGMDGAWIPLDDLSVYWSSTRSMARFGLLMYANGNWGSNQIVPKEFLNEASSTSQNINDAYGYLWWLNGKSSYHLPGTQIEFQGAMVPNAPADMYATLGKNNQKIYVVPSQKLVVIRMGEAADGSNFALSDFDQRLWEQLNLLMN